MSGKWGGQGEAREKSGLKVSYAATHKPLTDR
jgi:hypothetical protein